MTTLAHISLGSNLGDRKAILDGAIEELRQTPELIVRAMSSLHETTPVGGPPGQSPFLNAAAALETTLDPSALLHRLQEIENRAGRVRAARWGERTLDLDLLLFGDQIIDTPKLAVPHPWMTVRRFVLAPLEEIAPEAKDPLTGRTISNLRSNVDRRPSYVALQRWWDDPENVPVFRRIVRVLDGVGFSGREALSLPQTFRQMEPDPEWLLEQVASWLDRRRWSELRDRWLVTDFSYREIVIDAVEHWGQAFMDHLPRFVARLEEKEQLVVRPTFVVHHHVSPGKSHCTGNTARGTACISLQSRTPDEEVAEILSACAATRS